MSVTSAEGTRPSSRIRVHDAALYTDLMNSADWSRTIAQEQQRQQIAARRQHEAEEWKMQQQKKLEEAQLRAARETTVAEARRKYQTAEEAQLREQEEFGRWIDSFMRRHHDIFSRCAQHHQRDTLSWRRTVSDIYSTWEETELRPVREFIDAELRNVQGSKRRAVLRREMMSAFLAECNRTDRLGGRHALYRDIIDEAQYDPLRQLAAVDVRHPPRPRRETAVDARRREAEEVRRKYAQLALDYRATARESTTGVLSDPPLADVARLRTPAFSPSPGTQSTWTRSVGATAASSIDPPRVNTTAPCSLVDVSSPAGRVTAGLMTAGRSAKAGAAMVMPPLQTTVEGPDVCGLATDGEDALDEWMRGRGGPKPREADLPVTVWDKFTETRLGWMVTPEGDMKPSCERRKACALKTQHSRVVFDHFAFPRGLEGKLHTGKRVL